MLLSCCTRCSRLIADDLKKKFENSNRKLYELSEQGLQQIYEQAIAAIC